MEPFKIIGIFGLVLICIAMIVKNRNTRDVLSFFGGIALLTYSVYLQVVIFIVLQAVYTVVIVFDFIRNRKKNA